MLGDEIVNVNGSSLRGLTMEEARNLLRNCRGQVDIILARDPEKAPVSSSSAAAPVERRRRRKLPMIERPRSAPIYAVTAGQSDYFQLVAAGVDGNRGVTNVHDVCDFAYQDGSMKTVTTNTTAARTTTAPVCRPHPRRGRQCCRHSSQRRLQIFDVAASRWGRRFCGRPRGVEAVGQWGG